MGIDICSMVFLALCKHARCNKYSYPVGAVYGKNYDCKIPEETYPVDGDLKANAELSKRILFSPYVNNIQFQ